MMAAPLRVMFDSNAYDAILAHGDADHLRALIAAGTLDVITTHVQEDELRQIKDETRRETLLALYFSLQKRKTPASVSLWGISSWEQGEWSGQDGNEKLSAIQRNKVIASRDEIIGTTAKDHCDLLITEDKKFAARLTEAAKNLQVMDYPSFRATVLAQS